MLKAPYFFFSFVCLFFFFNLIALIIVIETEASLLALAKSICYVYALQGWFV